MGDTINPNTTFGQNLSDEKSELEDMLNKRKISNIPNREKCLFLFIELKDALRFWGKYGGYIYGVEPCEIYYCGDMNKIDNILDIFRFSDNSNIREAVIDEYWKTGSHTFSPCLETLTNYATVSLVLSDDSDKASFKEQLKNYLSVERTDKYLNLLDQLKSNVQFFAFNMKNMKFRNVRKSKY